MEEKRCIFHIPNYIDLNGTSGSSVRPMKMLHAFEKIGYKVDYVMGYGKERKKQIKNIKKNIKNGIQYSFVYSESSTMPTLLTEKNHIPFHPFLDFHFIRFCRKNEMKVGLYYRDIYWRFPSYGENMSNLKKKISIAFYRYDFKKYKELLNIIYLQTIAMGDYFPKIGQTITKKMLPPGCDVQEEIIEQRKMYYKNNLQEEGLNIFYVGGIGTLYDITPILEATSKKEYIKLTICCRKEEWEKYKEKYNKYLNSRISIVHASSKELAKYYKEADICSLYFPEEEYRNFVLPIKLFEYLSYVTPIIVTKGTQAAKFIVENDIGWEIPYKQEELERTLDTIHNNKELLKEKHQNMISVLSKNTWEERAKQVEKDLI